MSTQQNYSPAAVFCKIGYCLLPVFLGAGAALVLLLVASGPPRRAYAGTLTFPGCASTIQGCIDIANDGDTILISAGDYTESLTLSKAVSLTGALSSTTILHALPNTRVLTVTGAAVNSSVVISGLTFAGGHAVGSSCPDGCGGAILINSTAQPLFVNLTISNSLAEDLGGGLYADFGSPVVMSGVAVLSNTSAGYYGGGVYAYGDVTLNGGVFQNNQCTAAGCYGGGLFSNSSLNLTNTQFLSNTSDGFGGGVYASATTLTDGLFQGNQCVETGCYGGGLWAYTLTLTGTQFLSNTASYGGGGANVEGAATLSGGVFQGNDCTHGACGGGGLYAWSTLALSSTQFLNNFAWNGGGGVIVYYTATLTGGLFQDNTAGAGPAGGLEASGSLVLTGTQFLSNTAYYDGGGLYAWSTLAATSTQFLSNTAGRGGGAFAIGAVTLQDGLFQGNYGGGLYANGPLTATGTDFLSNSSRTNGAGAYAALEAVFNGGVFQNNQCTLPDCLGGGLFAQNHLAVTDTVFLSNTAQEGGGLYQSSGDGRLVNDLFGANSALSGQGDALFLGSPGAVSLLHTTIASPTLGSGAAIVVANGTVGITDTIIASDATGISQTAGSVYQDYNLFFGNGTNTTGTVSGGAHSLIGDPLFVNPSGGPSGYHLSSGSLAVDAGTDAGVTTDFEGETRPQGNGFDIGFDESPYTALADVGVTKSASDAVRQPGQTLTYTLVFSNAGPEVAPGVLLTDILPTNLIGVSYASSGAALTPVGPSQYAWQVANLAPGAGGVVTVTGVISGGQAGSAFTNTTTISTAYSDTNPANNTSAVSVTVTDQAITGLGAASSSPTVFNHATTFTASVSAGTNVSYAWGFGNGATGSGANTTYTFPTLGIYTALVTATNSLGGVTATTMVAVDDVPLAAGDAYSTTENVALHVAAPGVLGNDSDVFPGGLTAQLVSGPATLVLAPTGSFTYTPPIGFGGLVTFTYQASDSLLLSPATTVTITVSAFKLYLPLVQK